MKIYLYTKFDCVMSNASFSLKMFAGQQKVIETELPVSFNVFPLNQTSIILPMFFELEETKNGIVCSNSRVQIYSLDKTNTIVKLNPNYACFCRSIALLSTKNQDYEIYQDEQAQIKCGNKIICSKNINCIDAQLFEHENLIFCVLCGHLSKNLVVLDGQNNILIDEEISQIETSDGQFKTLLKFNDMQKQGLVKMYKIDENSLKKESEYPVYMGQTAKKILNQHLNSQAFFEAVRVKNLNLAKIYLSPELSEKITLSHLSEYFGNFDEIFNLSLNFANGFVLANSQNKTCSVFGISTKNNLIDNIKKIN